MLERYASVKFGKGDTSAAKAAHNLIMRFGDEPLPVAEDFPEIQRFSSEIEDKLEKAHYKILTLTAQSIKSLRAQGRQFYSISDQVAELETMKSCLSQVAIHPHYLYLEESNNKTSEEQEQMVAAHSLFLQKKYKTDKIEAVIGEMSDYVDLAFTYLEVTGGHSLFGKKNKQNKENIDLIQYDYARTNTRLGEIHAVQVGAPNDGKGLVVTTWPRDEIASSVYVLPIIKPKAA